MATAREGPLPQCPGCPNTRWGCRSLGAVLLGLLGGAGVALAQQHRGDATSLASLLRVGEPIVAADQRLLRLGWRPSAAVSADALDQERSGTRLASLSGCAGTGLGYCRFDYRRGRARLAVITVPSVSGQRDGPQVLRWIDEASGQRWGLCQDDSSGELAPCGPERPKD